MNKRLLTLSMVGLLTVGLASCSDVKQKEVDGKQVIITIKDTDYTADELLGDYAKDSAGVNAFYNAIYDVLVRDHETITDDILLEHMDWYVEGVKIYENPVGVLTNNPPFLSMLDYLSNFISLDTEEITERTLGNTSIRSGTRGLGAVGLPGDLTSPSRFVRASFIKSHITAKEGKESEISAAFHVLSSVEQQRGLVKVGLSFEYTAYSAVIDMQSATYYYRTYDGCSTKSISLRTLNLDSDSLIAFDA